MPVYMRHALPTEKLKLKVKKPLLYLKEKSNCYANVFQYSSREMFTFLKE